jgi:hypothetical protein
MTPFGPTQAIFKTSLESRHRIERIHEPGRATPHGTNADSLFSGNLAIVESLGEIARQSVHFGRE